MPNRSRQNAALPWFRVLAMGGTETEEGALWSRVEVPCPTLAYPYANSALTGFGNLEHLEIEYSPRQPIMPQAGFQEANITDSFYRGYPSMRGECYLWEAGEWWIRVRAGNLTGGKLGFCFLPLPEGLYRHGLSFRRGNTSSGGFPVGTFSTSLAAAATVKLLSVQDMLFGINAVLLRATTPQVVWHWRNLATSQVASENAFLHLEGPTLPFADIYARNTSGVNQTVSIVSFF